jgi:hypothetical protein
MTPQEIEALARAQTRDFYASSDMGRRQLYMILVADLGLLREATTPEAIALRNYACYFVREHLGLRDATDALALVGEILNRGK